MKWYSPIFIIPIVLVIALSVGWGFYKNAAFQKSARQAVTPIIPTHTSSSVSTYSASPSPTLLKAISTKSPEGWETFVSDTYKFHFFYPGTSLYVSSSLGCDNEPT